MHNGRAVGTPAADPAADRGTARVWALIVLVAVLVIAGFLLASERNMTALLQRPWATWWTLAALFAATESFAVHVPRGSSATSHSLREIPTVFALLFLPPWQHLGVVVLGAGVALLFVARQRGVKLSFNLVQFAGEATLAVALYRSAGVGGPLGLGGWLAALLAVIGASAAGALLTDLAIYLAGDGFNPGAALRAVAVNVLSAMANCSVAILTVQLAGRSPVALAGAGAVTAVLFLVLRGYTRLAARYSRLDALYRVVVQLAQTGQITRAGSTLAVLQHATELAGTRRAELYVPPGPQYAGVHVTLANDIHDTDPLDYAALPDHVRDALGGRAAITATHSCPGSTGHTAAMAAPLWLDGAVHGALVVSEPLFATAQFDADDLRMFEMFAAHCASTLHNSTLTDDLRDAAEHLRTEVAARDHEARHDALTGLANRREFLTLLERDLPQPQSAAAAGGHGGAVLLLALHDFREINEALGHQAGDQALIEIGRRLRQAAAGPVARLGGDQFAVLLTGSVDQAAAQDHARHLVAQIRKPIPVAGTSIAISASAGVAMFSAGSVGEEALAQADSAMWQARSSADGVHTYLAEAEGNLTRRLRLAVDLHPALDAGALEVWYQPKADAATGAIHAVEALLRWTHPTYGFIPPPEIVTLAERTGQMRRLTDYVLTEALSQATAWDRAGRRLGVAVNISTHDLHDRAFASTVRKLLDQASTPLDVLTLEITESGVMRDPERCLAVLDELAAMGVRLSVDDFGTGYSSLAYLDRLPVHEVKIDRSFVQRLEAHPPDTTVIKSTIDLGHALGLNVVAEGVENADIQHQFAALGCDEVQGYHIGRPAPAENLTELLRIPGVGLAS